MKISEWWATADAGATGKDFEVMFKQALELVGLKFRSNSASGRMWDIRPTGPGWKRLVANENVNIKVARTLWLFADRKLADMLPWEMVNEGWDGAAAVKMVKRYLKSIGIHQVMFLRPKDETIEAAIIKAAMAKNVGKLTTLLVNKNFKVEELSDSFKVRLSVRPAQKGRHSTLGSLALLSSDGKVFARSERPRPMGGTMMVAFRHPRETLQRANPKAIKKK